MIRVCVTSPRAVRVHSVTGTENRPHYDTSAPKGIRAIMKIVDQMFYNRSYHFTMEEGECVHRMKTNASDFTTAFISMDKQNDQFVVPVPLIISKNTIITGYDVSKLKVTHDADAVTNFKLLEWSVYLTACALICLMMMVIAARTLVHYHHRMKQSIVNRRPTETAKLVEAIYESMYTCFYGSSDTFRYLTLLFTVLCFYLSSGFNAGFKTSQMALEEPRVIKTYEDLLKSEKSLPFFYDALSKVSDQFQLAPEATLKRRVWNRLIKSGNNITEYVPDSSSMASNPVSAIKAVIEKIDRGDIIISSSIISNMLLTFACGSTSAGEEGTPEQLMRLFVTTDPSEIENLAGWALASSFSGRKLFSRKLQRFVESGLMKYLREVTTNAYDFAASLWDSRSHIQRQKHVCGSDYQPDLGEEVKALTHLYFAVFFGVCFCMQMVAVVVYFLERGSKRVRRVAPEMRAARIIHSA